MKVGILGDGAMAQAISYLLTHNKIPHTICSRKQGNINNITTFDIVFICISSEAIVHYAALLSQTQIVISCAKGIYLQSQPFISKIFNAKQFCVLSGPNFASEILQSQQTLTTVASQDIANLKKISDILTTPFFEIEHTDNVIGVEICGIVKNAIAIIMGYYSAKTNSWNEKSLVLTKIFQELNVVLKHFNIENDILNKSCGIGDIFLTCSSTNSRNYKFGIALYHGKITPETTVEGVRSLEFLSSLNLNLQLLTQPY